MNVKETLVGTELAETRLVPSTAAAIMVSSFLTTMTV